MPYKNPEDKKEHNRIYRGQHRELYNKYEREYKRRKLTFSKRCPECGKHIKLRGDRILAGQTYTHCKNPECKLYINSVRIHIDRTLSVSNKNAHGLCLKVIA